MILRQFGVMSKEKISGSQYLLKKFFILYQFVSCSMLKRVINFAPQFGDFGILAVAVVVRQMYVNFMKRIRAFTHCCGDQSRGLNQENIL